MMEQDPIPERLTMPFPLARQLARSTQSIESRDVQTESAGHTEDATEPSDRSEMETELLDRLKRWRRKTSAALGIPAFRVLTNATIERIAEAQPDSTSALESVSGVGPATIEQFGYDLVELIRQVVESHPDGPGVESPHPPTSHCPPSTPGTTSASGAPRSENEPSENPASSRQFSSSEHPVSSSPEAPAIDLPAPHRPSIERGEVSSDAYWTWRLFRDGYGAGEIESIRHRDLTTLDDDLVGAAAAGLAVDPSWISTDQARKRLENAARRDPVGG
jgi:ATP-dependent DNA helicase RecQ